MGPAVAAAARQWPPPALLCHPDASRQADRSPTTAGALATSESARHALLALLGHSGNAGQPRVAPASWPPWSRPGRSSAGRGHRIDRRAPAQRNGHRAATAPRRRLRCCRRIPPAVLQRSGSRIPSCVWTCSRTPRVLAAGRAREPGDASSAWLASRERKRAGDCVKGSLRRAPPALDAVARPQIQNRHLASE